MARRGSGRRLKYPQRLLELVGIPFDPDEQGGWTVEKFGRPYDLRRTRGAEERHVEVKGTTGAATSVELTINEVLHVRDKDNTVDLYVVSDIRVDTHTDPYTASGGTHFRYRVVATRYDKLAVRYEATVLIAAIGEWL
ncbi:protein NO VEIN domain-containing protein [Streptomyces sp. NPDC090045]|uniref:protein NO VEIN domain-containing protein n=1 Tax=Streptomyces sp. NPDC090045 TaxID=3365927 RepID=UPI00380471DB